MSLITEENINTTDRALLDSKPSGRNLNKLTRDNDTFAHEDIMGAPVSNELGNSAANFPSAKFGKASGKISSGSSGISKEIMSSEADLDSDKV